MLYIFAAIGVLVVIRFVIYVAKEKIEITNSIAKVQKKSNWNSILLSNEAPEDLKKIVSDFLSKDNIDPELYIKNDKALGVVTDYYDSLRKNLDDAIYKGYGTEKLQKPILVNCSPTFIENFNNGNYQSLNMFPDWFMTAYPDVASFFKKNSEYFREVFKNRKAEFDNENGDGPNSAFFRELIDRYKIDFELECRQT